MFPLSVPPAHQAGAAVPHPPPAPAQPWDSVTLQARHLCRAEEIHGSFWASLCSQEGATRRGTEPNTFSQPAQPTDCLGGCRALPCTAHLWLQLRFEPRCQAGEYSPASMQGKEGCSCEIFFFSFIMALCKWLAGCDGDEETVLDSEKKETRTFSPLPREKVIYVNLSTTSTRQ